MSVAQDTGRGRFDTLGLFGEWRRREPMLAAFALVMGVAMVPTLIAMTIDVRTFNGINVWMKPFKFELSTSVRCDARLVLGLLDKSAARGAACAPLPGIGLITLSSQLSAYRASLAEASHFNNSTLAAELHTRSWASGSSRWSR